MVRQVNAAAMVIVDSSEGCVLHAYHDPAGILTVGYGHTGPDVKPGMVVSQEQADAWRSADMARAAAFVEEHVHVTLTDNQFSALAEWTYNVGVGNFRGSTLLRVLNKKQFDQVPAELMKWTKAGGRVLPGLVARRAKEVDLWGKSEWLPQSTHAAKASDPSICAPDSVPVPRPSPPSLLERIRAWLSGANRIPKPAP